MDLLLGLRQAAMRLGRGVTALTPALKLALVAVPLASGSAFAEQQPVQQPIVFDARVVGDASRVRFVADLSALVRPSVFTLADPYRIIIDLPEVSFALPDNIGAQGRGLITSYRYGLISPGKSRIVIDVSMPVAIDKAYVTEPGGGQPARLVIDVVPTTEARFAEAARAYREQHKVDAAAKADRTLVRPGNGREQPIVVIDPGHGGIDNGARGKSGAVEKQVVLDFSKVLARKLEETGRYHVVPTRTEDVFVGLGRRVAIAREVEADLFVSIHANSFRGRSVRGAIVYTVSDEASEQMAAELAASENLSDVLAGLDLQEEESDQVTDILFDLTRRETRNFGVAFARSLVEKMAGTVKMFKIPHQQASFKVLEAPDVPSALIELGYLTNAKDEKLLGSAEWQQKAAGAIVEGIDAFFSHSRGG